jgi:hypothetical protein
MNVSSTVYGMKYAVFQNATAHRASTITTSSGVARAVVFDGGNRRRADQSERAMAAG